MSLSGSTTFSICFAVGAGRTSIGSNRKRSQALKTRKGHKRNTDKTLLSSAGVPMTWTSLPLRDTETLAFEPVPTRSVKPLPQFTHEGFIKKKDFKRRDTVEGEEAVPDNEDVAGFEYSSEDEDNLSETKGLEETPTNLANEDEGRAISEKGVPAIMRCFDTAKIYVKAGDGGNGVVAFRREKYVPLGGPCGGNGGRGGDIFVEVDSSMNSLLPFRKCLHFRAENGSHGRGRCQDGAKGDDVVVRVPPGTVVRDASDGTLLMELTAAGQRAKILSGGRGGRGNASFKNVKNKAPQIAENGEEGSEMWLDLELKLVADVGIIGAPNAGKSTLLSSISAAKPNIADYPFTTLLPNLGVVALDCHSTMVVADLPGLLEGAHRGYGLGHEFLRHIERCHVLIHVIDGSSCQPEYEFDAVRLELDLFSPEIAQKPFLVAFNKIDIPEAADRWNTFNEKFKQHGIQPFSMSAAARVSTMDVVHAAYELLQKKRASFHHAQVDVDQFKDVASMLRKNQNSRLDEFEISFDKKAKAWIVHGSPLERFIQMTNWEYFESFKRFQRVLEACGVDRALRQCGIKEGDTVFVGEMELEWHDSTDFSEVLDRPRYSRGSRKWPH